MTHSTSCEACPFASLTRTDRSTSAANCSFFCAIGHYSIDGLEPCGPCPIGSFNEQARSASCLPCPSLTTTLFVGSTSSNSCQRPQHIFLFSQQQLCVLQAISPQMASLLALPAQLEVTTSNQVPAAVSRVAPTTQRHHQLRTPPSVASFAVPSPFDPCLTIPSIVPCWNLRRGRTSPMPSMPRWIVH